MPISCSVVNIDRYRQRWYTRAQGLWVNDNLVGRCEGQQWLNQVYICWYHQHQTQRFAIKYGTRDKKKKRKRKGKTRGRSRKRDRKERKENLNWSIRLTDSTATVRVCFVCVIFHWLSVFALLGLGAWWYVPRSCRAHPHWAWDVDLIHVWRRHGEFKQVVNGVWLRCRLPNFDFLCSKTSLLLMTKKCS